MGNNWDGLPLASECTAAGLQPVASVSLGHSLSDGSPTQRLAEAWTWLPFLELGPLGETGSPPNLQTNRSQYQLDVGPAETLKTLTGGPLAGR